MLHTPYLYFIIYACWFGGRCSWQIHFQPCRMCSYLYCLPSGMTWYKPSAIYRNALFLSTYKSLFTENFDPLFSAFLNWRSVWVNFSLLRMFSVIFLSAFQHDRLLPPVPLPAAKSRILGVAFCLTLFLVCLFMSWPAAFNQKATADSSSDFCLEERNAACTSVNKSK